MEVLLNKQVTIKIIIKVSKMTINFKNKMKNRMFWTIKSIRSINQSKQ